jgi:hypothetical protein
VGGTICRAHSGGCGPSVAPAGLRKLTHSIGTAASNQDHALEERTLAAGGVATAVGKREHGPDLKTLHSLGRQGPDYGGQRERKAAADECGHAHLTAFASLAVIITGHLSKRIYGDFRS